MPAFKANPEEPAFIGHTGSHGESSSGLGNAGGMCYEQTSLAESTLLAWILAQEPARL